MHKTALNSPALKTEPSQWWKTPSVISEMYQLQSSSYQNKMPSVDTVAISWKVKVIYTNYGKNRYLFLEQCTFYLSFRVTAWWTVKRWEIKSSSSNSVTYFDADATDVGLLASHIRQQDVLGFQVTVDDAFAVEDAHGSSNLLEKNSQCVFSQRPLG